MATELLQALVDGSGKGFQFCPLWQALTLLGHGLIDAVDAVHAV